MRFITGIVFCCLLVLGNKAQAGVPVGDGGLNVAGEAVVDGVASPADKIFRTKPYLQNPVGGGITVSWLTHVPVYSWVEYGTDTLHLKRARTVVDGQVICNNYIHKIRLDSLEAGEVYYYRVCSREILSYEAYSKKFGHTAVSAFHTFHLPKADETDFTALVFNDLHQQYKTMAALCEQVKDCRYDFVIFNGDCIDDPANEQESVRSLSFYNDKVGASEVPVFYLRGTMKSVMPIPFS